MPEYKTGRMPNTDFRYEEFEGLLGSFQLSLRPLQGSIRSEDRVAYDRAMEILGGFAQRYGVQSQWLATLNHRAQESWGNASVMSNWSMLDMTSSFWRDFGVGYNTQTEDGQARIELARLILGVFDRHRIARVGYETIDGRQVPVEEFDREKSRQTLVDILG